ncbi:MAG: helicase-related protein, partial [Phocaeicola sp.]
MIATEAGAEGINLQFCSLLVNYDMPWNPQRIEQRIGRCHRYGQKYDVIVVNFLNRKNVADQRVYEILDEKFKLFDGVFGSSDEVLGSLESGLDIEKRLFAIYQSCRAEHEIQAAFNQLQAELDLLIQERINSTKKTLLENFDEDVIKRLKVRQIENSKSVDRYNRHFWLLSCAVLQEHISEIDSKQFSFHLDSAPISTIPTGGYHLNKEQTTKQALRIAHPLGQYVIKRALAIAENEATITFNLSDYPYKVSLLESSKGKKGFLRATLLKFKNEHDSSEELICTALTEEGHLLPLEFGSKLLELLPASYSSGIAIDPLRETMDRLFKEQYESLLREREEKMGQYISYEIDKFESWADDHVAPLENEIVSMQRSETALRSKIRKERNPLVKIELEKERVALKSSLSKKRNHFFELKAEYDDKIDSMLHELSGSLKSKTEVVTLFDIHWSIS